MNAKKATIHELFQDPLRERGFTKAENLLYKRPRAACVQAVAFGRRREPRGKTLFSFGVGVFHRNVHALLWPDDHEPLPYTFGMPVHLLHPSREFFEWSLSDTADVLRRSVLKFLDQYGLPYMEQLSDLQRVHELLDRDSWGNFFVLDPVTRTLALAATETVLGQRERAIARLRDHLAKNAEELPKKWLNAKILLSRIAGST